MRLLVKMSSSSDNQIVHLRRQFQAIDTDNTGLINAEKLIKAMKEHFTEEEAKKIIEEIDSSGSQMINYTEFIAATMKVVEFLEDHEGQGKIDAIFQQFDTNNDGKISASDIKNAM